MAKADVTATRTLSIDPRRSGSGNTYSPEIDGLRALAVIAVIVNHFERTALPSGHLGVDVFFVISGFVITSSLHARRDPTASLLLVNFYLRRVKRLLPALIACVLVTSAVICLFNPDPGASLRTGIAALFGVSNLYLFAQATDYFGASAQLNVFTHTWSLGVEEQFYLFFPFIVLATGLSRTGALGLFSLSIGLLSATSIAAFLCLSKVNTAAAFYFMPARFWELGAGCLAFALTQRESVLALVHKHLPPAPVLIALCLVFAVPTNFSAAATVAGVALTAALIVSLRRNSVALAALTRPEAVYVGRISYSLYLWHWSVVSLSHWTVGIHWWSIPIQAALMFTLAAISHRWLETPLRRARWTATAGRTIGYGATCSLLAALVLFALDRSHPRLYSGSRPEMIARGVGSLIRPYAMQAAGSTWSGEACVLSDNEQVGKAIPVVGCTLGNFNDARRRVLVVGNSFSAAFVRGFDELVARDNFAVTITSSWGASAAPGIPNHSAWNKANDYYWSHVVPSLVSRLSRGDAVFLINDLSGYSPKVRSREADEQLLALRDGLAAFADRLRVQGISLFVLHGNPFAREANCEPDLAVRQWFAPFGGPCKFHSRLESLARRAPLDEMLVSLEKDAAIRVIDLFQIFCPAPVCTYEAEGGQVLYRDAFSHPSIEAAQQAAPLIRRSLVQGGGE